MDAEVRERTVAENRFAPVRAIRGLTFLLLISSVVAVSAEDGQPASAVGPLLRILQSGNLPQERVAFILDIIAEKGNAHDLGFVYGKLLADDGYQGAARKAAINTLLQAARTRNVKPAGELSKLASVISAENTTPEIRAAAIELAGLWAVEELGEPLKTIALDDKSNFLTRKTTLEALSRIGGQAAIDAIDRLIDRDQPQQLRYLAAAAYARMNTPRAARIACALLADGSPKDDPGLLLDAFLQQQEGPQALAQALAKNKDIPQDVARLALRHMYAMGRTDKPLADALSKAAGMEGDVEPLTPQQLKQLIAEVTEQGDPQRGEKVFRRADLNCMKCHSLNGAGPEIGPDLVDLGGQQPTDYLIESVMLPEKAVKEEFIMARVTDFGTGKQYQGLLKERTDEQIVLKDAEGRRIVVPISDPDDIEVDTGGSLMPQGLVKFMTHQELVDLVSFLSMLGKAETTYAKNTEPIFRRWRVLKEPDPRLQTEVPDEELFLENISAADATEWGETYSSVEGTLPLDPLYAAQKGSAIYVQCELVVTSPGKVGLKLNSPAGLHLWLDGQPVEVAPDIEFEAATGRRTLTFRADPKARPDEGLKATLFISDDSTAQAELVNR